MLERWIGIGCWAGWLQIRCKSSERGSRCNTLVAFAEHRTPGGRKISARRKSPLNREKFLALREFRLREMSACLAPDRDTGSPRRHRSSLGATGMCRYEERPRRPEFS